jgi:F420-dependent oxidoreductase-like protein
MRIGTTIGLHLDGPQTLDDVVDEARTAAAAGLSSVWANQVTSWDALTAVTVAGLAVPDIALGTAVTTTYPRHPLALASQALTTNAAVGGRLDLGIGPSHAPLIEGAYGIPFDRPGRHTREYLEALGPLLRGEVVEYKGEIHQLAGQMLTPGATPPAVLLSALGPVMLRIAGELTDGTLATWTTPRSLEEHIVPRITAAATAAGRPAPRVVSSVPVAVTPDPDGARAWVAERFGMAADLPSYAAILELGGVSGIDETVVAGDESSVEQQLRRLEDAGLTEFIAVPYGPPEQVARTIEVLAALDDGHDRDQQPARV